MPDKLPNEPWESSGLLFFCHQFFCQTLLQFLQLARIQCPLYRVVEGGARFSFLRENGIERNL